MNAKTSEKVDLFIHNDELLMRKFPGWIAANVFLGAYLYTNRNKTPDPEKIKTCKKLLRKTFGVFSHMRGYVEPVIIIRMSMRDDPEEYINGVNSLLSSVSKSRLLTSEYDVLCAMIIYENKDRYDVSALIEKMRSVYASMQKNHPVITGKEDLTTALMFAMLDEEPEALLQEMEACYALLKPKFRLGIGLIQTMSALMAVMKGTPEEKVSRVNAIIDALKARKLNYKGSRSLPVLAGLLASSRSPEELADDVKAIADSLKGQAGFGVFRLGKEGRMQYAVMLLISSERFEDSSDSLTNTLMSIVEQQIINFMMMMTFIMISSSTHTVVSSSSSGK